MSVLGVEYGCTYVLEGPDGARAVLNDSTDKDFVGILSPESSGLDSSDVRESANDRAQEDGGIHGDFYEGRRPVVLVGTIIASSATDRNEKVAKIKRASRALRRDATLTWQPQGAASKVSLSLRRQQPLRITKGFVKEFQIPMVAAYPFPRGKFREEAGSVASPVILENLGDGEALPIVYVFSSTGKGTIKNPIITNATAKSSIKLNAEIKEGEQIEIDFRSHTILRESKNEYSTLDFVSSTWWTILPGKNEIKISAGEIEVAFQDTYI